MARDIHDGPAQSLSNIILNAKFVKVNRPGCTKCQTSDRELKGLIKASLHEIRRIIFDLRPMTLDDLGLVPTLQRYTANFSEETGIDVVMDIYNPGNKLSTLVEIAVFRLSRKG